MSEASARRAAACALAMLCLTATLGCGAGVAWEPVEVGPILKDLGEWDAASAEERIEAARRVDRGQHDMTLATPLSRFACGGIEREVAVFRHDGSGLEFSLVPGGTFRMGSSASGERAEAPLHVVTIPRPFLIARTECTEGAWRRYFEPESLESEESTLPVAVVSFLDVERVLPPLGFRLPTEAEWEYACRAGVAGKWCFGDDESLLPEYAFTSGSAAGAGAPLPVGGRKPNAFGLFDVHGNVWELCADAWHDDYAGAPADGSAWVGEGATLRVVRGGSWRIGDAVARSALRGRTPSDYRNDDLGFRPVRSVAR